MKQPKPIKMWAVVNSEFYQDPPFICGVVEPIPPHTILGCMIFESRKEALKQRRKEFPADWKEIKVIPILISPVKRRK